MDWLIITASIWGTALVSGALLTWVVRELGHRGQLLDQPDAEAHKQHAYAVPNTGGISIAAAFVITLISGMIFAFTIRGWLPASVSMYLDNLSKVSTRLIVILLGATAFTALGVCDDRKRLSAKMKFGGQFLIAGCVAYFGARVTIFLDNPFLTWLLTTFWIVFLVNAINFYDNMDSMAGGCSAIAAFLFLLAALYCQQHFVASLAAAVCGAACGFLIFNWPPASIFMGDGGSHFLGFMLAVIGTLGTFYTPGETSTIASILIPLIILAVPIFDVFAVVIIRLRQGRPIYIGDKMHISHRFVKMGLCDNRAAWAVHLLHLATGIGGLALLWLPVPGTLIILIQTLAVLCMVSLLHHTAIRENGNGS